MDSLKLLKRMLTLSKYEKEIRGFDSEPLLKSIFCENFVKTSNSNNDDMLFFIYKLPQASTTSSKRLNAFLGLTESKPKINVFRKSSTSLPLSNSCVDWNPTTCLNLILQKFCFSINLSICTQTSSKHYQILSKHIIPVHPSPSRHSVICKEISEEYSYPEINFAVDNFDDYLHGIVIGALETIYIELIVSSSPNLDSKNVSSLTENKIKDSFQYRIFSTAIHYETLLEACSKKNIVKRHGQSFGLIRALDPSGNGTRTELIIKKKIKRSLSDGSSFLEKSSRKTIPPPSNPVELDSENLQENEEKQNNLALEFYLLNRIKNRVKFLSSSHRQGLIIGLEDLFDNEDVQIDETLLDPWCQKGFEQSLSQCRKSIKQNHEMLNICVTRIALPIESILQRIISC